MEEEVLPGGFREEEGKYEEPDQEGQEQELYEHYRYVVDPVQSMLRIDKYL